MTGDANPDWTASIRNTVTIGNNLTISGLVDVKRGGQTWNGTKGALKFFGASKDTEPYHGAGKQEIFGQTYLADQGVGGPGAGKEVTLNWASWFINGIGSFFTGPGSQTIEDSGFVKLRDVSVTYSIRDRPWLDRAGFLQPGLVREWAKPEDVDRLHRDRSREQLDQSDPGTGDRILQ